MFVLNRTRNNPLKRVRARSGRAGQVLHGFRLYCREDTFFCSISHIEQISSYEVSCYFEVTNDCGKKLSTSSSHRVTPSNGTELPAQVILQAEFEA